jgi:hypothetical protein
MQACALTKNTLGVLAAETATKPSPGQEKFNRIAQTWLAVLDIVGV